MVVLAIPLLEAAGAALAEALPAMAGGAATAGILSLPGDTEQGKSKTQPVTRAVPKQGESCKKCPPDGGSLVTRSWSMSETSSDYQARVTGFAPGTEWSFSGLDFDGFRSAQCLLQEAKARYDQFFDPDDGQPKFFFRLSGARKITQQARIQSAVVASNPPSQLNWYFMQPLSYRYFARLFATEAPIISTLLQP
jgi:Restriction endonuclease fold toxin 5